MKKTIISVIIFVVLFLFLLFIKDIQQYSINKILLLGSNHTSGKKVYWVELTHANVVANMDIEYHVSGEMYMRNVYYVYNIPYDYQFQVEYSTYFPSISRIKLPAGCELLEKGSKSYIYVDSLDQKTKNTVFLY